jgi:hypothetical protein
VTVGPDLEEDTMTTETLAPIARTPVLDTRSARRVPTVAVALSIGLAVVTAVTCALTFFLDGILLGPAVMNGSARGTSLILLLLTVPLLVGGIVTGLRGSTAGLLVWLGAAANVLYQSVLFLFATPFNDLFLLDVAMFGLALWTLMALLSSIDARELAGHVGRVPRLAIAIYVWAVVALNTLAWFGFILPGLGTNGDAPFLRGTGMTTNPIYVQDLAFWLPMMALAAWWFLRERAWGTALIGAMLVMWLLESITVGVDQWMGHSADPASNVATAAGAALFALMTVIGIVPVVAFFRRVR